MTLVHGSNSFNVEATLNRFMQTELDFVDLPAWWVGNRPAVVFDLPESALITPSISITHLPISQEIMGHKQVTAGENAVWASALMDVSVWASRSTAQWSAQLRMMTAMVETVITGTVAVPVRYFWDSEDGEAETGHKINLGALDVGSVGADLNPDVMRRRMTIRYTWVLRADRA